MSPLRQPDRRAGRRRASFSRSERRAHLAALRRRIAELESDLEASRAAAESARRHATNLTAQIAAQRGVQGAAFGARLDTLLAICAALLVTHEIQAIMGLIVQQAVRLFPGASGALLYRLDANTQELTLRAASAGPPPRLIIGPGQGVAGRALLAPRAMLMVGPELELALDELDPAQLAALDRLLSPWPPASALLAPLRIEGRRLGALVIYGGTQAHLFIPRDLPFIQALADLAAVAIAENEERERATRLQHDLAETRSLHAETQARLDTAQAQLLQSAKLAAVGELAASVAHEINNPLYAARNSLYLVEQDLARDAPELPFLALAQNELGRIARIITRMRDFYRPARAELDPTDLNGLLLETIDLVQTHLRRGQVRITTDLAADLPRIVAHTDQMRQVFLNMMLNA